MTKRTTTNGKSPKPRSSGPELQMDLFPPEMLTHVASKMSAPMTSEVTPSATSSLESAAGRSLSGKLDGPTIDPSGAPVARASLSARQAKALDLMTSGTFGHRSIGSSSSSALQSSLESRLRDDVQIAGSTLYRLTWKPWRTPLGPSRFQLRASDLRKNGTGSTGWPTPKKGKSGGRGNPNRGKQRRIEDTATTIALTGSGMLGSSAAMAKDVRLNPEHSRWLMGYPDRWTEMQPMATPSSSLPQERSLARISTITTHETEGWSEIVFTNSRFEKRLRLRWASFN